MILPGDVPRHVALLVICALLLLPSRASREGALGHCGAGEAEDGGCITAGVDAALRADGESAGGWGGEEGGGAEELAGLGPGLKWDSPLDGEIFHVRHRPMFAVDVALPPEGVDVLLELFMGTRFLGAVWNNCTRVPCTGAGSGPEFCSCRCSGACDCSTCAWGSHRTRGEFSVDEGAHGGGDYHVKATASFYEERTGGHTTLEIGSRFTLVDNWRDAFQSTCMRRSGGCPAWGGRVRAPAYPLPGNLYNRITSQAAGSLAMQPGIIFVSPAHGRVYAEGESVSLSLRFVDFLPQIDGKVSWCVVQVFEEGCGGPTGCRVSEPFLPKGAWVGDRLARDCEHDAAGCEIASFRLAVGYYRAMVSLDLGHTRTQPRVVVFAVENASREELDQGNHSAFPCHPTHCSNPHSRKNKTLGGGVDASSAPGGGGKKGSVLLVYEWTPMPRLNGDADRLRQLTFALDELGYATHIYASNCLEMHGDYLTMAPRPAGARITCQLVDTELPALLQEGPAFDAAFIVSTEWYYPRRSLVQSFVPLIREIHPSTKVIVMADVLLAPDGVGLDDGGGLYEGAGELAPEGQERCYSGGSPHADDSVEGRAVPNDSVLTQGGAAGSGNREASRASGAAAAQLMGLASADAVGVEVEEDGPWLRSLFPNLPVLPVRFSTVLPAVEEVAPFDRRAGILWFGSAHRDNLQALEWSVLSVLPRIRRLLGPEWRLDDGFMVVAGKDTDSSEVVRSAQGVKVLGQVQDVGPFLDSAKVCLSPTMLRSRRFQTKHLQALSRGLPVVTTERGVAGYGLASRTPEGPPSYGSGHGVVVGSPGCEMSEGEAELLAQAVVDLITSKSAWEQESSGAIGLARTRFAFAEGMREVEALLGAAGEPGRGRAGAR